MKKQIRKAMICTVAMMLIGVVSLTGVTYAWFSASTTSTVSGVNIGVVQVDGIIEISDEPNPIKWGTSLPLNMSRQKFEPASTAPSTIKNGNLSFFSGRLGLTDGDLLCTEPLASDDKEGYGNATHYIRRDIYIRNATPNEMVIAIDKLVTSAGTSTAASAMRLAIVDQGEYTISGNTHNADTVLTTDSNKVYIYEFDATNHILIPDGDTSITCGVKKATVEDPSELKIVDGSPVYEEPKRYTQKEIDDSNGTLDASLVGRVKDESIFFDKKAHEDAASNNNPSDYLEKIPYLGDYGEGNIAITVKAGTTVDGNFTPSYHKLTIYLWLEGQDVDCINAISGGTLPISIGFTQVNGNNT